MALTVHLISGGTIYFDGTINLLSSYINMNKLGRGAVGDGFLENTLQTPIKFSYSAIEYFHE